MIGIPRSLSYYSYGPLWQAFLGALDVETAVSAPTCKSILDLGVTSCVDDACLPVKVFHGHVLSLDQKADGILVPMIMSEQKKEYSCPLICGLPEMARHSLNLATPLLPLRMNLYTGADLYKDMETFGLYFTHDRRRVKKAYRHALALYDAHCRMLAQPLLDTPSSSGTLGILGHPYILYDDFFSGTALCVFREAGFATVFPESISENDIEENAAILPKKMFWSAGKRLFGSARQFMHSGVCGMVYLSSFGCGVDSIIADLIERMVRRESDLPFLMLTLDEHTGEAGLKTRAEAFIDMLQRRQNSGRNLSPHGQYLHRAQGVL
jgi:predicted nucleotide-binding protein (sugar kinase/HSP70/actin superfamily)